MDCGKANDAFSILNIAPVPKKNCVQQFTMLYLIHNDAYYESMEQRMNSITLRDIPGEVQRAVKERAAQKNLSLNRAVISLLQDALGIGKKPGKKEYHDLDHLCGRWSRRQAQQFDDTLKEQRKIDREMWE